ncbi:MAG: IS1182 family transposase [Chloroflexi bacterium]|nr:IS1182 family transposase [Chloroflexota bacterium]
MQGRKSTPEAQLFIYNDPYAQLPRSPFYDALAKHLDLEWVRAATQGLYADGIGRPSLDPVVFVKLMLVGFFENVVGDSELSFRVADSLTVRRFLGYGLDERPPDRTTIVKTRQRWPEEVFEAIFMRVLEQLKQAGLVKGENLATDTVLVDANASMDSLRHRELGCTYRQFVKALYAQDGQPASTSEIATKDAERPNKASNADWVSATDPEAAVAVHRDGHAALSYRVDATTDLDTGVIVAIGAAAGDLRDSVDLPQRVEEARENLAEIGLAPEALTADRGHYSEDNLVEIEAQQVAPIIRAPKPAGKAGFRTDDFVYDPESDCYICPAGNSLQRKGLGNDGKLRYVARASTCRRCEHFGLCTKSRQGRAVDRPLHQAELQRNRERVRSPGGRELLMRHRHCAEAPWSYAKLYGGLARINTRGLANATKKALIQGIGWNLMKLIAHLTGLAPRGKSEMRKAGAGSGRATVNVCALIRHFGALIGHYAAMLGLRLRLWRRRRHTDQAGNPPPRASFSRKRLLSQGC